MAEPRTRSRVASGQEFQWFVRLFEHDEFARRHRFKTVDMSRVDKGPRNIVAGRRLVSPTLAV